jgi:hypothetical protein
MRAKRFHKRIEGAPLGIVGFRTPARNDFLGNVIRSNHIVSATNSKIPCWRKQYLGVAVLVAEFLNLGSIALNPGGTPFLVAGEHDAVFSDHANLHRHW